MPMDRRYEYVKIMHAAGKVKTFADIFIHVPKTVVAKDLGYDTTRLGDLIENPTKMPVWKILKLAEMTGMDWRVVMEMVVKSGKENDR